MRPRPGTRCSLLRIWSSIRPPRTSTSPSLTNTDVLIVRLLVTRSTAPVAPALMLEVSCSIFSFTPLPSLICGVIFSFVPTSWRWMVWNGLTVPTFALPAFVNWPVTNGTS